MEGLFIFVGLLALTCLLGHVLHLKKINWITEGSLALLVGLAAGGVAYVYYEYSKGQGIPTHLFSFDTEMFFDVALPAIIFNAGFSVKKKLFFQNFLTLVLFGVVGTFLTAGAIAVGSYYTLDAVRMPHPEGTPNLVSDSLALGAIFASSDSIATLQILDQEATPLLYSLVFGEGVVNDATSIVLLRAIQKISGSAQLTGGTLGEIILNFSQLFVFSLVLGVGVGLLSAYIIKHWFFRHSTDREVCLVALMGFLAFLLAESLELSGIFSVFFAGITMSHYTWHSLSPSAKVVTIYLFRILSFLTELFLFIYAGFGCWSTSLWHRGIYGKREIMGKAGVLASSLLVQVFLGRGGVLLLLVPIANMWRPKAQRIGARNATVIWWAGSARGAVTVALAYHRFARPEEDGGAVLLHDQMIVVASMAVVVFTTVVLGAVTGPFLDCLIGEEEWGGEGGPGTESLASTINWEEGGSAEQPLLAAASSSRGAWRTLQKLGHWNRRSYIHFYWHKLDAEWLQPLFGGRKRRPEDYHSGPPSPGRQAMYNVIGPHVLRRYGTVEPSGTASADGEPLPVEIAEVAAGTSSQTPPAAIITRSPPGPPAKQGSLDDLFRTKSARMDDDAEGLVAWQDDEKFGEDAYLAAGAPDAPTSRAASQTSQSSRRGLGQPRAKTHLPIWPTPFDNEDEEKEERQPQP